MGSVRLGSGAALQLSEDDALATSRKIPGVVVAAVPDQCEPIVWPSQAA